MAWFKMCITHKWNEVNVLKTEDKKKRLKMSLDMMTETELKKICFDSFIDGLDKGIQIKDLKNKDVKEKETAKLHKKK